MKILLFTLEYPPFKGGVANYYWNIVKYWPSCASFFVKATDDKKISDDRPVSDIIVLHNNDNILLKNYLWPKWLLAIWQLWRTIKKQTIKHILVGHILPLGTVTYIVTRFIKIPYSVILHGMDFTYVLRSQRKKWLAKKILNNAKYIICGNSYTAGLVKKFVGDKQEYKVGVVNPGIEHRVMHNHVNTPQNEAGAERVIQLKEKYNLHNKIVLFSIGRLVKRKGFDKVIEAMPYLLKKVPNLIYVIAGSGSDEEYLKTSPPAPLLIRRGETEGRLIFLGKVSDEEKWAWMNLGDIFIMPARNIDGDFEGFGIVYLEANLCNKPVIAGDSGGVRDAVEDYVNGILVDPENIEAIAEGILELALNQILRQKLGEQGWHRAVEEFNWEKQVRKIYNLIKK